MRAFILGIATLFVLAALLWYLQLPPARPATQPPPDVAPTLAPMPAEAPASAPTVDLAQAREEVRKLQATLGNFLTAVKDPYRPPLGDNLDIARALGGDNRLGEIYIATNDTALDAQGRLVDRWGSPYHFHPCAPDAIDVRSAGPDRVLFTSDDLVQPERAGAATPAPPAAAGPH